MLATPTPMPLLLKTILLKLATASITYRSTILIFGRPTPYKRVTCQVWGLVQVFFYVGERAGDLDNSFFVDDYTRVDAAVYYERENFRAALNFKNLFDVRYFVGSQDREQVIPGAPFTVLGTVSVEF